MAFFFCFYSGNSILQKKEDTMAGGRPRTVIPEPDEMIKLGEEMVEWVERNQPLHLSEWWSIEKFIVSKVWECMQVAPEFFPYYERALRIIGKQYLDKTSNVREGVSQRWQRVYFKDLRKEEDETSRYLQSLKLEELEKQSPEVLEKFGSLMELMRKNQERKIEESKSNEESKS